MINQKKKGSRRELEFAHICQKQGFDKAHRTNQFCGNTPEDSSDVVGLPHIHCEVKGTQVTTINKFIRQSKRDTKKTGRNEIPMVFYKRNGEPWLAVMDCDDFFNIYKIWLKSKGENNYGEN